MLKKTGLFLIAILLLGNMTSQAQRFAYVDTDYILEKLPEYRSAQKKLDQLTKQWKQEIQSRVKEIDKLYNKYKAEKVLLPEDEKQQMEEKIMEKEEALKKYKEQKFGDKGELFQKRKELIKPIQDRVFEAVQQLAKEESLDFIFDKAGAVTMLYTNAQYDRSDEVLESMGVDVDKAKEDNGQNEGEGEGESGE